jgi:predicted RNase H-like HicB family nuclease
MFCTPKFYRHKKEETALKIYTAIVERCTETGLYVGFVSGFAGAHTQAESLDELNQNLQEVIEMLLEDGMPVLESQFVGIQNIAVA